MLLNTLVDCFCFRNILSQLKVQRWNTYCHKTEWIVTKNARAGDPRCPQCKRIRTTRLTLNNDLLVSFFRKALQDIRFLPRNPFTEWLEIDRQKTDFRITVLNVTIDDVDLIYDPFLPHFESMIERFE